MIEIEVACGPVLGGSSRTLSLTQPRALGNADEVEDAGEVLENSSSERSSPRLQGSN